MIEDIVIQYRADTTDLARVRKELGLVDDTQGDLLEEFKKVNAAAQAQVAILAQIAQQAVGGQQAAGDQQAAIQEVAAALAAEAKAAAAASQAESEGRKAAAQAARLQAAEAERARKAAESEGEAVGLLGKKLREINDLKAKKLDIIDEDELARANAELVELEAEYRRLDTTGTQATRNVGDQTGFLGKALSQIGPLVAGAFAVDKLVEYAGKVVQLTAEYQKSQAVLTNTLGSAREANKALAEIQTFAATTPFSINELTASYIKLANQGFKPTTAELTKLGDLASSTGKSFDELTEGILDAQQGEFERLKEFGILASKNGDKVTFTFKEQKTVVDANASSIRAYILGLGDLQGVSGSMAAISGTLAGQFSNVGDSIDQLFLSIGKKLAPTISTFTGMLGTLVGNLTNLVNGNAEAQRSNIELLTSTTQQVTSHKALADTYETLVKKTNLTSAEKTQLKTVTQQLVGVFGESITAINAETGALEINLTALKRKIVVEQALQSEAARNLLAEKLRLETAVETAKNASAQIAALIESTTNGPLDIIGNQIRSLGVAAEKGIFSLNQVATQQRRIIGESGLSVTEYNNRVAAVMPTLGRYANAITFQAKNQKELTDINNQLLAQGIDLNELAQQGITNGTAEAKVLGLLGAARKALKDEQDKQDGFLSESALKASEERVKSLAAEVKRLETLADQLNLKGIVFKPTLLALTDADLKPLIDADRKAAQLRADAARELKLKSLESDLVLERLHLQQVNQDGLNELRDQLESGQITRAEYARRRAALEKQTQRDILTAVIETAEKELLVEGQTTDERLALQQRLKDAQGELYDLDVEKFTEAQEKKAAIEQELRQQAFEVGRQLIDQLFASEQQELADRLSALQTAHDYEIGLAGNTADAKGKIDQAYAQKEAAIRKQQNELAQKQAIFNKALAIGQIAINTALGITKVIAEVPKFDFGITTGILIAAYAALGAIQAGLVIAQPVAKFAAGTDLVTGGRAGVDSVHALLMPGERVVPTAVNQEYFGPLSAIQRREIPAAALAQFIVQYKGQNATFSPAPVRQVLVGDQAASDAAFQERLLRGIAERPVNNFIFDAEGSRSYQEQAGNRSRSLNTRNSFGD